MDRITIVTYIVMIFLFLVVLGIGFSMLETDSLMDEQTEVEENEGN